MFYGATVRASTVKDIHIIIMNSLNNSMVLQMDAKKVSEF